MSPIRCARAALAVQAQGTPLAHKKYFVMLTWGKTVLKQNDGQIYSFEAK